MASPTTQNRCSHRSTGGRVAITTTQGHRCGAEAPGGGRGRAPRRSSGRASGGSSSGADRASGRASSGACRGGATARMISRRGATGTATTSSRSSRGRGRGSKRPSRRTSGGAIQCAATRSRCSGRSTSRCSRRSTRRKRVWAGRGDVASTATPNHGGRSAMVPIRGSRMEVRVPPLQVRVGGPT